MSKHTEGPWEKEKHPKAGWDIRAKNGRTIVCDNGVQGEANARLIAAAPDLLEACKSALDANKFMSYPYVHILEIAIKKAEGES